MSLPRRRAVESTWRTSMRGSEARTPTYTGPGDIGWANTSTCVPYDNGQSGGIYESGTDSRRCQTLHSHKHYLCAPPGGFALAPQRTPTVVGWPDCGAEALHQR